MGAIVQAASAIQDWYRRRRAARSERLKAEAARRHAAAQQRVEFSSPRAGRLDRYRFLRREHMFLEWSSWHASLKDD